MASRSRGAILTLLASLGLAFATSLQCADGSTATL